MPFGRFAFLPNKNENNQTTPTFRNSTAITAAGKEITQKLFFPNLYELATVNYQVQEMLKLASAYLEVIEVTLTWRGKNGSLTRTMHYMFVEPHLGSWSVTPMMDPAKPDLVSTDLGVERLTNRILTAIGAVVFVIGMLIMMRTGHRLTRAEGLVLVFLYCVYLAMMAKLFL